MDDLIIAIHALLGGVALVAGTLALATKKGARPHVLSGRIFFWAMLVSALLAISISWLPGHENRFLFAIGLFTTYLILSGYRALALRGKTYAKLGDWVLSGSMSLIGIGMLVYGVSLLKASPSAGLIQLVFGSLGLIFGLQDIRFYRQQDKAAPATWLRRHLGRMCGGYIAAFTAFLVVNEVLPSLWAFLAPTLVGSFFIAYWIRRVRLGKR